MASLNSEEFVLVTGGSGGIGSALCRALPSIGLIPLVGFNSNARIAKSLAKECGGFAVKMDMSNDDSILIAIKKISTYLGSDGVLKGVVLAASPSPDLIPFRSLDADLLVNQFRVNVVGSQLLLAGLIKTFFKKDKSGIIIGILSEAIGNENQPPTSGMGAYIIAKSAMKVMLRVCLVEYPWLTVRTISPGFTKTKMLDVFDPRYLELAQSEKQFTTPEEVAQLIIKEIML
ncbi:MAG: SDR family oxidoreductase [Pseudomonadota bacterium]|nr:SDR family oxidoreductase [Pseudomonadota bacterium]